MRESNKSLFTYIFYLFANFLRPFNTFDRESIIKGSKIIRMLFIKYDETKDMIATLKYADKLQKGREVNYKVLQWALEAFIVHSMDAKKAGIK